MLSKSTLASRGLTDSTVQAMPKAWVIGMLVRKFYPNRCDEAVKRFGPDFLDELAAELERRLLVEQNQTHRRELLEAMALVKMRQNKFAEAERLFAELLYEQIALVGRNHPDLLTAINALAYLCEKQNKTKNAEDLRKLSHTILHKWMTEQAAKKAVETTTKFSAVSDSIAQINPNRPLSPVHRLPVTSQVAF